MLNKKAVLKSELYTERLNNMYATISEFQQKVPDNPYYTQLKEKSEEIAIAHRESRFYCNQAHFTRWENMLSEAEALLTKAGCTI